MPLPQPQQAYSSGTSSPRVGSLSSLSSGSILNGSAHSFTTVSSNGPKTPSPTLPTNSRLPIALSQTPYNNTPPSASAYTYAQESYQNMNSHPPQEMYYPSHMSSGQPQPPQTVTSSGMGHYTHQQPPLLQPGPAQYSNGPAPYNQYYSNGLTSPQSNSHQGPMSHQAIALPLPAMAAGQPGMPGQGYAQQGFDQTGQVAPNGMKPRVTATLWEDEGSLCFQVEARGVCVARREGEFQIESLITRTDCKRKRQSYDKWDQAVECCRNDSRTSRWYLEE